MSEESETCGDHGGTNREGEPCGRPAGWGMDASSGKCKHHAGTSPDGSSHEGNQNARTHGLHSTPEYLLEDVDEKHLDTYHATHEALCTRYEEFHGFEPDFAAKKRLSRISVEIIKEDLADEYLKEENDGHILTEEQVVDYDPDKGKISKSETSKVLTVLTDLKRETRLTLKDMGLLKDPDSQQADAVGDLATIIHDEEADK